MGFRGGGLGLGPRVFVYIAKFCNIFQNSTKCIGLEFRLWFLSFSKLQNST